MSVYLLDTNVASDLFSPDRPIPDALRRRFLALGEKDQLRVSSVTLCELEYGFAHVDPTMPGAASLRASIRIQIGGLLDACRVVDEAGQTVETGVIPVTAEDAALFGAAHAWMVRHRGLTGKDGKRHAADTMIAAAAVRTNSILVSRDGIFRAYAQVEGSPFAGRLVVEDWHA
jgi:predicted nucleic acid-binding protein